MANESGGHEDDVSPSVLKLDILGASFTITADEDETYLNNVLGQYSAAVKNTQNISGIKDPLNVAILTGFLLCDEINKIKLQTEYKSKETQELTARLVNAMGGVFKACKDG